MISRKHLIDIFPIGYHILFFLNYFGCICFFVDIYHYGFYLLRNLHIWESSYLSYSNFSTFTFLLFLTVWLLRKEFVYECSSYFIASSFTHISWIFYEVCLGEQFDCLFLVWVKALGLILIFFVGLLGGVWLAYFLPFRLWFISHKSTWLVVLALENLKPKTST